MSEQPITHCEHGIDRAYRCIDCIEAERDQLRARVEELERIAERYWDALVVTSKKKRCLRASIVALADEREKLAAQAKATWGKTSSEIHIAETWVAWQINQSLATELRQLAEGNSAAAQEGL